MLQPGTAQLVLQRGVADHDGYAQRADGRDDPGGVRVIAVRPAGEPPAYRWNFADRTRRLVPGDRVVVAATRSGLARLNTPVAVTE